MSKKAVRKDGDLRMYVRIAGAEKQRSNPEGLYFFVFFRYSAGDT